MELTLKEFFEIKKDEKLDNLIEFAGGFSEDSHGFTNLIIKRISNESTKVIRVPFESINSVKLFPRDSIVVHLLRLNLKNLKLFQYLGQLLTLENILLERENQFLVL